MKLKSNTYPYPVLRNNNDDYIQGNIELAVELTQVMNETNLRVSFSLEEAALENLIDENKARKIVHIECPQTLYRKAFIVNGTEKQIPLKKEELRGRVEVTGFIIAVTEIADFQSDNFNDLYGGLTFDFERGNILAEAAEYTIDLFESEQSIEKLSSIINVVLSYENKLMTVDSSSDKIVIALPKNQYEQYATFSKTVFNNILISVVIVPGLVEVLNRIKIDRHAYEDTRWYISLKHSLESIGIDLNLFDETPLEIAQKLLKDPIQGAINVLKKVEESGAD